MCLIRGLRNTEFDSTGGALFADFYFCGETRNCSEMPSQFKTPKTSEILVHNTRPVWKFEFFMMGI